MAPTNNPGNEASPSSKIYRHFQAMSKKLGTFPPGHQHAGEQRMIVLEINEGFTSQIPSCWALVLVAALLNHQPNANLPNLHPAIPLQVPPLGQRLQNVEGRWHVLQCPHCDKIWHRDVNACRYMNMADSKF